MRKVFRRMRRHPPHGLRESGSSKGTYGGRVTSLGIGWGERDRAYAINLEVDAGLHPAHHRRGWTIVRIDGCGLWLDQRPFPDSEHGKRIRVTPRAGCPSDDQSVVGVRNPFHDSRLRHVLLPRHTHPNSAIICFYRGMNGRPWTLSHSANLTAAMARSVAKRIARIRIAHIDGAETSCPMDDGSAEAAAFSYPHHRSIDIWESGGCSFLSNDRISAEGYVNFRHWAG